MEGKKTFGYGWFIAVLCGVLYFMSSGFIVASAQIINPAMMGDIGISATVLGLGFTVFVWCQGLPSPLVGMLISKIGTRWTTVIGGLVMSVGAVCMMTIVHDAVGYLIFFGVFMSVGSIMAGQVSVQSTIGFWFQKRRGIAMSLMMGIGGLGGFAAPLIVSNIIGSTGAWQAGWTLIAVFGVAIAVLGGVFMRTYPSDKGLEPDGGDTTIESKEKKSNAKIFKNTEKLTAGQILRTPYFWFLALLGSGGFVVFSLQSSTGVAYFTSIGFDAGFVAGAASVYGIIALVFKFASGTISDYVDARILMIAALCLGLAGEVCAACLNSELAVYLFYVCNGISFGTIATCLPTAVANYFGTHSFSKALGVTMMTTSIVSGFISTIVGAVYDSVGSYAPGIMGVAVLVAVCIVAGLLCRPAAIQKIKGEGQD